MCIQTIREPLVGDQRPFHLNLISTTKLRNRLTGEGMRPKPALTLTSHRVQWLFLCHIVSLLWLANAIPVTLISECSRTCLTLVCGSYPQQQQAFYISVNTMKPHHKDEVKGLSVFLIWWMKSKGGEWFLTTRMQPLHGLESVEGSPQSSSAGTCGKQLLIHNAGIGLLWVISLIPSCHLWNYSTYFSILSVWKHLWPQLWC